MAAEVLDIDPEQVALFQQATELLGVQPQDIEGWYINRIRPDGTIDAEVPLTQLDAKDVPVDPDNVETLIGLFNEYAAETGGTGQRDPVSVCHVPGEAFYVTDGFHRCEVQAIRDVHTLNAIIEPKRTYEQVIKRRFEYARKHKEIKFAREVVWMQEAWERSKWSDKIPKVVTAFRAFQGDYGDYKTGDVDLIDALSEEDYQDICEWVRVQCADWCYTPKQIRENLAKVESFDPELMKLVYQKSGQPTEGRIGLGHVEAITEKYPFEFDLQKAIVDLVITNGLTVPQTKLLIERIEAHNPFDLTDLLAAADKVDIGGVKFDTRQKGSGRRRSTSTKGLNEWSDADLLDVLLSRLDEMKTVAAESDRWTEDELRVAFTVFRGLAQVIDGFSQVNGDGLSNTVVQEVNEGMPQLEQDLDRLTSRFAELAVKSALDDEAKDSAETEASEVTEGALPVAGATPVGPTPGLDAESSLEGQPEVEREEDTSDTDVADVNDEPSVDELASEAGIEPEVGAAEGTTELSREHALATEPTDKEKSIVDFLEGRAKVLPRIKSRADLQKAQEIIDAGGSRRRAARVDELQGVVDEGFATVERLRR